MFTLFYSVTMMILILHVKAADTAERHIQSLQDELKNREEKKKEIEKMVEKVKNDFLSKAQEVEVLKEKQCRFDEMGE